MKKKKKEMSFVKKNIYLILMCFILLSLTTIGYSALNQKLYITGDLALRSVKDIRITNLELISATGNAYEQYNYRYTSETASMALIFPELNSSVTYRVTVNNYGDIDMTVDKLDISTSHSAITYTLDGIDEDTIIKSKESLTFTITLTRISDTNTSSEGYSALLELTWKEPGPYTDPILVGNDPDLLNDSLTPVVYDEEQSSWVVADTTTEWYNYSKQEWANAVILESGVTKSVGDTVLVPTDTDTTTEVTAMYVWIPRYSYTIKSEDGTNYYGKTLSDLGGSTASKSTPGAIDIKFISTDIVETGTAQYTGDTAANWHTHPAFQWDTNSDGIISSSENIKGIWVGKFETNKSSEQLWILPFKGALVAQNVSEQFTTSLIFKTYLSNSMNIDSHMMKSTEWGAVAYLSQSIYGKYGNNDYTGKYKEIYHNDKQLSGHSMGIYHQDDMRKVDSCGYNDIIDRGDGKGSCGGGASTTGNITGIYDMSGGADERTMEYYFDGLATLYGGTFGSYYYSGYVYNYSGFTEAPDSKYYDSYNSKKYYGKATTETAGWYKDSDGDLAPWGTRGGSSSYGTGTDGVFRTSGSNGKENNAVGFRAVLLREG